jgi:hypothetical protein
VIADSLERSSAGLAIACRGTFIGMVQRWAPTQSRPVDRRRELSSSYSRIRTARLGVTDVSIELSRYDLWARTFEDALFLAQTLEASRELVVLYELWSTPTSVIGNLINLGRSSAPGSAVLQDAAVNTAATSVDAFFSALGGNATKRIEYTGFFERIGRTATLEDRRVLVDASFVVLQVRHVE